MTCKDGCTCELQLRCYKFIIQSGKEHARVIDTLPNGGVISVDGRMTCVTASSEEEARAVIERYCDEFGLDARWVKAADVKVLEITTPKVLCWVEQ